jgi:putative cell wall-binding protein
LFVFGPRAADGGNVTLNGHRYILQLEWSNADDTSPPDYRHACVGGQTPVRRIAGPDRINTAVLASRDVWAPVASAGPHAGTAVIARSDDYADALAGVPLAGAEHGPLLLTPPSQLDARVGAEVRRILPVGTKVFVLGGTSAISPSVVSALQQLGYAVTRLAGGDRYATAVGIADDGLHDPTSVLLATGTSFADALGAGAAAAHQHAAVLLTAGATMPAATANYLSNHAGTLYAIGGPAAAAAPGATPIVGDDRYDTARRVATTFFTTIAAVDVATGATFPDALGGGAHAAALDIPLVLTDPAALPDTVATYLGEHSGTVTDVVVFGGDAAVSNGVLSQIRAIIT